MVLLVCLGASHAAAQAAAEYGGAVAAAGAHTAATQPLKSASGTLTQDKSGTLHLPARPTEDLAAANRKALEAHAGKDAAKVMLRSVPNGAWVRVDGKPVGRTPLVLIVAPKVYKVQMEGPSMELGDREVDLAPQETCEVELALKARYPTHLTLSWHAP